MNMSSIYVTCPYYVDNDRESIICEGLKDDMRCRHTFTYPSSTDRHDSRKDYMNEYCCDKYQECLWAQAMERKYEE